MSIRFASFVALLAFAASPGRGQGTISTYAGSSKCCASVDGGQAVDAWLTSATAIAVDRLGNLYISQGGSSKVRKVSPSGIITTVAGNGTLGYTGDGGPATGASFMTSPTYPGLAVDAAGNLYISDSGNQVVRKIDTAGIVR